jgi:hypothetical protein
MGLTWGAVWFAAGIVLARIPGCHSHLPFALLFAPLGVVTGVVFSGFVVALESRRQFERMTLSRFAGWGAVSGLLLSGIFAAAAAVRGGNPWGELLLFGAPLVIAGASCGAGTLAVAGAAERRGLPHPGGESPQAARAKGAKRQMVERGD